MSSHNLRNMIIGIITVLFLFIFVMSVLDTTHKVTLKMQNRPCVKAEITNVETQISEKTYYIAVKAVPIPIKKTITKHMLTLIYTYKSKQYEATVISDKEYKIGDIVTIVINSENTKIYEIKQKE